MSKTKTDMGREIDDAFRREAVRILTTSGRTIRQVDDDLGIGMSSLSSWAMLCTAADADAATGRVDRNRKH